MKRGGKRAGAGMKPGSKKTKLKPASERRQILKDFRLPQVWIDFLKTHKGQGSRMIEKALMAMFGEQFELYKQRPDDDL